MNSYLKKKHEEVVKWIGAAVMAGLLLFGGVAGVVNSVRSTSYNNAVAAHVQDQAYSDLIEVAVGNQAPNTIGPERELAVSLERIVENNVGDEAATRQALEDFNARPNQYRGIEETIGRNPFAGTDTCSECGPLAEETIAQVIAAEFDGTSYEVGEMPVEDARSGLTALGLMLEAIIVWQVFGAMGAWWALKFYGDPLMTWTRGDGRFDWLEYGAIALAPLFMTVYLLAYNKQKTEELEAERESWMSVHGYGEQLSRINRALAAIDRLPANVRRSTRMREERQHFEDLKGRILAASDSHLIQWSLSREGIGTDAQEAEALAELREAIEADLAQLEVVVIEVSEEMKAI